MYVGDLADSLEQFTFTVRLTVLVSLFPELMSARRAAQGFSLADLSLQQGSVLPHSLARSHFPNTLQINPTTSPCMPSL